MISPILKMMGVLSPSVFDTLFLQTFFFFRSSLIVFEILLIVFKSLVWENVLAYIVGPLSLLLDTK